MEKIKIEKISNAQRQELSIPDAPQDIGGWAVWECEPSVFDWHYSDKEVAYVYEGKVKVKTADEEVAINEGDLVTFPKGLNCTWQVLERIRKVYKFE